MSASADTLTNSSRVFYERTRTKIVMSIVIGAAACYLLGYCAVAGGNSSFNVSFNSLSSTCHTRPLLAHVHLASRWCCARGVVARNHPIKCNTYFVLTSLPLPLPPTSSPTHTLLQSMMAEKQNDDEMELAYSAKASGYGFGAFCYIIAFVLAVAASISYSPLFCGSDKERKMIKSPEEIGDGYSMYNEGATP